MKKKRMVSWLLAVVMCLSILPFTVSAAAQLSLDKTNYEEGETIVVSVSGITEQMVDDRAFVSIYRAGANHNEYGKYDYPEVGACKLEFEAPEYGLYEMRLYAKDGQYDDTTLAVKIPFSVGGAVASATAKIELDKNIYAGGEKIIIKTSGITKQMVDDRAFVAVYKVGAAHNQWGTYTYPKENSDEVELRAPEEHGSYEIRLYRKDGEYTDETFVTKVNFTVGNVGNNLPGTISLEKNAYLANGIIEVNYSEIPDEYEKNGAFVAIYKTDAKHNQWGSYDYVKTGSGIAEVKAPNLNGEFEIRLYSEDHYYSDATFVMSVPFTLSGAQEMIGSSWASDELETAEVLGLIPDILQGADLTADITRAEFAAVSVKVYEALSGTTALPNTVNPFTDTADIEVLKAYNLGITTGVSATSFEPATLLNREQAATMLTRTFKRATMNGWTIQDDAQFALTYDKPAPFADDADISGWAKDSVYFMVANGIINGVGDNKFAPQNTTTEEEATGYANATREQALLIAVRMVENLK